MNILFALLVMVAGYTGNVEHVADDGSGRVTISRSDDGREYSHSHLHGAGVEVAVSYCLAGQPCDDGEGFSAKTVREPMAPVTDPFGHLSQ